MSGHIGVINGALRVLEVAVCGRSHDEFEAVGLGRYRHNDSRLQVDLED